MRLARDVAEWIVDPVCDHLARTEPRLGSRAARQLLIGTAVYESGLAAIVQHGGPALSWWQVEPVTHDDIVARSPYREALIPLRIPALTTGALQMAENPAYACAVARLVYWRAREPLPVEGDVSGLASYYKQHYNTVLGKGNAFGWARAYRAVCAGIYP
jgi:hypothetical protein